MAKLTPTEIQDINRRIAAGTYVYQEDEEKSEQVEAQKAAQKQTRTRGFKQEADKDE